MAPPPDAFTPLYVPLLNIPAADIALRPEFKQLFHHANITASHLVTLDDFSLSQRPELTRWILVDHNSLQGELGKRFSSQITGIIDHHEDENTRINGPSPEPRVVEKCGSCTSLVVRTLKDSWNASTQNSSMSSGAAHAQGDSVTTDASTTRIWDAQVAKMSLASILIDTVNLTATHKVERADEDAAAYLEAKIKLSTQDAAQWDRTQFFEQIDHGKQQIEGLEFEDILRRDFKQWKGAQLNLGISSVVKPLAFLADKAISGSSEDPEETFVTTIGDFMAKRNLDIFCIMTAYQSEGFQRELYIQALSPASMAANTFAREAKQELGLENHSVAVLSTKPGAMDPSSEGPTTRFTAKPPFPVSSNLALPAVPHVTIIRPVKGIEPRLYDCLAATFHQTYPISQLRIYFCISTRDDPALPILERLISDFPNFDAQILIEEEDPNLTGRDGRIDNLGPNPKIRNMSRAYRESATKGNIIWILDCNVWVDASVAGRMVDLLCGLSPSSYGRKYKFVHQLPLAVEVSTISKVDRQPNASPHPQPNSQAIAEPSYAVSSYLGGRLEEMFLSTSHAKFYTAISAVAVAPCTVGKSNMFRRSHLNALTESSSSRDPGIDYFSENICEDHLISDLLWKSPVPEQVRLLADHEGQLSGVAPSGRSSTTQWDNHGLLSHSLAIQPTDQLPLHAYLARRTRWLRVRKFTVPAATFVEPGTESLLCSAYGAFGLTTLPWCNTALGIPQTWTACLAIWALSVMGWCAVDSQVWRLLHLNGTLDASESVPTWIKNKQRRPWESWLLAWVGRESLALPIWLWAVVGGTTVVWRGRRFWVGMDMKVHEIDAKGTESNEDMGIGQSSRGKNGTYWLRGGAASAGKDRAD
ncbi:MAG: hypothetical protein Q9220_005766 [cf. Caloplaca sp. 1 TL-2023]